MGTLDEVKKRPIATGVGIASIFLFFVAWNSASPTLEFMVRLKKAPDVADAAYEQAKESREWIDAYIAEQRRQREFDQKLAEQAAEYQKQMLDLQRQQQSYPNQPAQQSYPPQRPMNDMPKVWWEQTQDGDWYCTDGNESWWPNQQGECE